jgi:hypothetical protein
MMEGLGAHFESTLPGGTHVDEGTVALGSPAGFRKQNQHVSRHALRVEAIKGCIYHKCFDSLHEDAFR